MFFPVLTGGAGSCIRSWANASMPNDLFWADLWHNGSQWVACGESKGYGPFVNFAYSSNGINWSAATGTNNAKAYYRVRWNGTYWGALSLDAVNPGNYARSSDGIAYTQANWSGPTGGYLVSPSLSTLWPYGTLFTAGENLSNDVLWTSNDMASWGSVTMPSSRNWGSLATNGVKTVVLGATKIATGNKVAHSDGIALTGWAEVSLPFDVNWETVMWTGRCFFAKQGVNTGNPKAARSYDGVTWTAVNLPDTSGLGYNNPLFGVPCADANGTIFLPLFTQDGHTAHTVLYASIDDGDSWCLNTLSQTGFWHCSGTDGVRVTALHYTPDTAPPTNKAVYGDP